MAIFRTLKTLIKTPKSTFAIPFPFPLLSKPSLSSHFSLTSHSRFLSPLFPSSGPLFLSSPPWKLSQLATPLYVHGDLVLREVQVLRFPMKLGSSVPGLLNRRDEDVGGGGGFEESFLNLPNLISLGRLVSGPFLGWMIINEWYLPAFVGLAISGATDWLDGYMARKMGINSVMGSYLDPLADKVLIGCVVLAMVENNLLHPGLVGLVVVRDLGLIGGAVYKRASSLGWEWKSWSDFFNLDRMRPQKVEPLFLSKVNTVFQLVLVAAALLQPEFGTEETQMYITYLSWLVASTTVGSTAAYGAQQLKSKSMLIRRDD